jgi:hypothetical protein
VVVVTPGAVVVVMGAPGSVVVVVASGAETAAIGIFPRPFARTEPVIEAQLWSISASSDTFCNVAQRRHLARTRVPRLVPFTVPLRGGQPGPSATVRPVIVTASAMAPAPSVPAIT